MSNLNNNNVHNLKLRVNKDEYWDFFLNKDAFIPYSFSSNQLYTKCLISHIDISNEECVQGEWLHGLKNRLWENINVTDYTLKNIGFTGVDNGLIRFRKDRISNKEFLDIYTKSKYDIKSDEKYLKLHQVSGNTLLYEYPSKIENGNLKLNGGFYQGFFETECEKYKVLPSIIKSDWHFEFVLKREEFEKESSKTLNDKYPENKGIFFYIGTRAENKWIYEYEEEDECDDLSPDNFVEDATIKRKDYIIGNFLSPNPEFNGYDTIDNYINDKYYSDKVYDDAIDASIFDEYVNIDEKPPIIDEEKNTFTLLGYCCDKCLSEKETIIIHNTRTNLLLCGCNNVAKVVKNDKNIEKNTFTCCMSFGDDYIDDFGDLDDGTEYLEGDLDISDFQHETDEGFRINLAHQYFFETDNKYLLFNRTIDGYNVDNWKEGAKIRYCGVHHRFKGNLFLLMNRTKTGYTVDNIDELIKKDDNTYNVYKDIYNNALAFQITDKGEIGYKYLTLDCESENKIKVIQGFSKENLIKYGEWSVINVRIKPYPNTMRLYFYVNGKLVFISKEIMKLEMRKLDEIYEKQEGVPYNISLGGGSQGLAETILPNYMLLPTKVYPIEKNFGGSFIGYIKSFKFYDCHIEYNNILKNFDFEIGGIN